MILPSEQIIKIDGVSYKLSKFDLTLRQEFLEWTKKVLPNPFEGLAEKISGLPLEIQKMAYEKAEEKAELRGTMQDPDVIRLIENGTGAKKMLSMLFRKHHPNLTEDECIKLIERGMEEHGEAYFLGLFNPSEGEAFAKSD